LSDPEKGDFCLKKKSKIKKPELLAPAGNLEKLRFAIIYGADAVYISGKNYGLRAAADNFSIEEMRDAVDYAHNNNAKIYVAINIYAKNSDFKELPEYLKNISKIGIDAIIVADPGILDVVKNTCSDLPVHLSTQANTTNKYSAGFWEKIGVSRVGLARELNLNELEEISNFIKIEKEIFVHGAMCISYSGRCLLSKYLADRDANRGDCAHSCRWKYYLMEEQRKGVFYPVYENNHGTYFFNSKDLCLIEYIPNLINIGIDSFKIEGRMKSLHYISTVVKIYREVIDAYFENMKDYKLNPEWKNELEKISHRHYTTGFVVPDKEREITGTSSYRRLYDFVGVVKEWDKNLSRIKVEVRNKISVKDNLEILQPEGKVFFADVLGILDFNTNEILGSAHANYIVYISISSTDKIEENSILRRKIN
jgi:putative protease